MATQQEKIYLNRVNGKFIDQKTKSEGNSFKKVRFECDRSATGFASITVADSRVYPSKRKDGTLIDNYSDVFLGYANTTRKVRLATGDEKNPYESVDMTNKAISDYFETARKRYNESKANSTEDTQDVVEETADITEDTQDVVEETADITEDTQDENVVKEEQLFINNWSEKLCHIRNKKKDGSEFYSISFPCDQSESGFATFSTKARMVSQSKRKDGTEITGFRNIRLGHPTTKRDISIVTGDTENPYDTISLTNEQILAYVKGSRKTYNESNVDVTEELVTETQGVA